MLDLKTELVEAGGHRKVRVVIRRDGAPVEAELISPYAPKERRKAAERLARHFPQGDAADDIERLVLETAEKKEEPEPEVERAFEEEGAVVRPELVLTPAVVGVAIPEMVLTGKGVEGRWRHYLAWEEGGREGREVREMGEKIEARRHEGTEARRGDGGTKAASEERSSIEEAPSGSSLSLHPSSFALWVRPVPGSPGVPCSAGWTAASRKAWLAGAATPSVAEVFAEVYKAIEEFIDVEAPKPAPSSPAAAPDANLAAPDGRPLSSGSSFSLHPSSFAPHPVLATLALWTLLTYCYPAWDAVPYLYVGGPAGSGKTRVFELLSRMCFRPLVSSNLSAPALFRTLHEKGGTLLLDEAERLKEGSPEVAEIRSILLAGYKRGGKASRLESTGGDGPNYRMQEFDVYGPKAIACIAGIEGPLATRCIGIQMMRSLPGSPKPRRRLDSDPGRWQRIRDLLHECLLGELGKEAVRRAESPETLVPLGGRSAELWQPLLALARAADPAGLCGLYDVLVKYAVELVEAAREDHFPAEDLLLLTFLTSSILKDNHPTAAELLARCEARDGKLFTRWTAVKVALTLKLYGIKSVKSGCRREFRTPLEYLKRIEQAYGVDLNTANLGTGLAFRQY